MKVKRIAVFLMALVFTVTISTVGFADTDQKIKDTQNQIDGSQQRINKMKDQYDDLSDKVAAENREIKKMNDSISAMDKEISNMNSKIKSAQAKIDTTTKELDAAVQDYNEQDERMSKRINTVYKNGTSYGYIEVLLDSTSFSDFVTRTDILKKIMDYDIDMLREMKDKREAIEKKKAELEQNKTELVALKSGIEGKKNSLVKSKSDRQKLVAIAARDAATLKGNIDAEQATAERLKKELASLLVSKGVYDGRTFTILKASDFPSGTYPRISSGFGSRVDPITGKMGAFHAGIDISTSGQVNIPVYAMSSGTVVLSKWYGGYGNAIVIDHGSGLSTLYGHNNKLLVIAGQKVQAGQKIALSGSTGRSTGPHVHFGVMKNGEWVNPSPYLSGVK